MPSVINARDGQSMFDLCLMAYGNLDNLVAFLHANGVADISASPSTGQAFSYEPVETVALQGLVLATAYLPAVVDTGIPSDALLTEAGIAYQFENEQYITLD